MNDDAALWIPIRLLISITIISFFTALVLFGSQQATESIALDTFKTEILDLKQSLETLYQHGTSRDLSDFTDNPGSKRVYTLNIPDIITRVDFGRTHQQSMEYTSSITYQKKNQGMTLYLSSEIRLIQGIFLHDSWQPDPDNIGLRYGSGSIVFTAELVHNSTGRFILLYVE